MSTDSPPRTPTWPPDQARRLDLACDRFEASWRELGPGQAPPRIEDVLDEAADEDRPALLRELIGLEVYYRRQRGEDSRPEEYRQRFPDLDARSLARAFAGRPDPGATRTGPAEPGPGSPVPSLLGRFELLEEVGSGGFGTVWRARDSRLGRVVALKVPHPTLRGSPGQLERCRREARAAAQLRHPGVVTVHEVADLDGLPVLVCDFVTGGSLRDLARSRRLTFRETASLVAEAAEAVDYAHGMGLVHRDLKPGNILLESAGEGTVGRPLVTDFGLARREDVEATLTREGEILGTPAYMSPEQAAGRGHQVDRRTDVYSLGVVLYELLTGHLPFGGSAAALVRQVLTDEPPPPGG